MTETTTSTAIVAAEPPGRRAHAMVAVGDGRLVVVGGWTVAGNSEVWLGDTWVFDTRTSAWTQLDSVPVRGHHALATDGDIVVLAFGSTGGTFVYGDVWQLRNGTWERTRADGPAARTGAVMAHDPVADVFVLSGGDEAPLDARIADAETWTFDGDAWLELTPDPAPGHTTEGHPVLYELAMVHDPDNDLLILLAGGSETWAFDTARATWERRAAPPTGADFMIAAAYHQSLQRLITYGGAPTFDTADTWAYDASTDSWALIATEHSPGPIADHAMAYDPATDRTYLFGGTDEPLGLGRPPVPSAVLWAFDGTDWEIAWEPEG